MVFIVLYFNFLLFVCNNLDTISGGLRPKIGKVSCFSGRGCAMQPFRFTLKLLRGTNRIGIMIFSSGRSWGSDLGPRHSVPLMRLAPPPRWDATSSASLRGHEKQRVRMNLMTIDADLCFPVRRLRSDFGCRWEDTWLGKSEGWRSERFSVSWPPCPACGPKFLSREPKSLTFMQKRHGRLHPSRCLRGQASPPALAVQWERPVTPYAIQWERPVTLYAIVTPLLLWLQSVQWGYFHLLCQQWDMRRNGSVAKTSRAVFFFFFLLSWRTRHLQRDYCKVFLGILFAFLSVTLKILA